MYESSESSLSPTDDATNISRRKERFNIEIGKLKNDSKNNPLFTSDRYEQTILLVQEAKQKCFADRNAKDISLSRTYDIVRFGDRPKLVKKNESNTEGGVRYYVPFSEKRDFRIFDRKFCRSKYFDG